jgi:hypothetical protein
VNDPTQDVRSHQQGGFAADERGAKKRDYWFTVLLTDPVAIPLSRFLARRRLLTPDQVTMLALVAGLALLRLRDPVELGAWCGVLLRSLRL